MKDTTETHRGIKTTTKHKHETVAKTIKNRLGQLSISLPRIDDKKRWAGYPGIAGIARKTSMLVPECKYYVEPFAGTVKVYQELLKRKELGIKHFILNDTSNFTCKWLIKEFHNATITNEDFVKCMKRWDSPETFFLIDQPWNRSYYEQKFSSFNRDSVAAYDNEIIDLCRKIEGKFIITTRKENQRMIKSGFKNKLIRSEYIVSGRLPKVLLTTNLI